MLTSVLLPSAASGQTQATQATPPSTGNVSSSAVAVTTAQAQVPPAPEPRAESTTPAPLEIAAPFGPAPPTVPPTVPAPFAPGQPPPPERWWIMRELQVTWLGALLDDNRVSFSGWTEMSYTASTSQVSNLPVGFNDRANTFLLQQHWFRLDRPLATNDTSEPSFGYHLDVYVGSDYRWILMRGLFNSQLDNSIGAQNLYGVDPIQFYVNAYFPKLFRGTEFRTLLAHPHPVDQPLRGVRSGQQPRPRDSVPAGQRQVRAVRLRADVPCQVLVDQRADARRRTRSVIS